MGKTRLRVPLKLPLTALVLLVLGLVSQPFIQSRYSAEELANNTLLGGISFILIFIAIVLTFITLIALVASILNNKISTKLHQRIEIIFIAGIVLGILGMFQSWVFFAFRYGFLLLLVSTLGFILWSHITPARAHVQE